MAGREETLQAREWVAAGAMAAPAGWAPPLDKAVRGDVEPANVVEAMAAPGAPAGKALLAWMASRVLAAATEVAVVPEATADWEDPVGREE